MRGLYIGGMGSFGDSTLPKVGAKMLRSMAGAKHHWAADNLPLGAILEWTDVISGNPFVSPAAPSQRPIAYESSRKVVRFDGVNDRIDATVSVASGYTIAFVGGLNGVTGGKYFFTGGQGTNFNLGVVSAGTRFIFNNGSTLAAPVFTPDSGFRSHIIVADGANSIYRLDGNENTGTLATAAITSIRLGASGSAYFATDHQGLMIFPFAASLSQREAIHAALKAQYNTP